jgi:hypothetical protein
MNARNGIGRQCYILHLDRTFGVRRRFGGRQGALGGRLASRWSSRRLILRTSNRMAYAPMQMPAKPRTEGYSLKAMANITHIGGPMNRPSVKTAARHVVRNATGARDDSSTSMARLYAACQKAISIKRWRSVGVHTLDGSRESGWKNESGPSACAAPGGSRSDKNPRHAVSIDGIAFNSQVALLCRSPCKCSRMKGLLVAARPGRPSGRPGHPIRR